MGLKRILSAFALLLFSLSSALYADFLPVTNGRYSGGPAITINLTDKQRQNIRIRYKRFKAMKLTKRQRAEIAGKAGLKDAPSRLLVIRPEDAEGDCTCGLVNIGLIIEEGVVEIPLAYLANDKEARGEKADDDGTE